MWTDPIVAELHHWREEHAKRFDYDLQAMFDDVKRQEQQSGLTYMALPIKRHPVERNIPPRQPTPTQFVSA